MLNTQPNYLSLLTKGGRHCFICSNRWLNSITVIKADKPAERIDYGEVCKVDGLTDLQISKRDMPIGDDWTNIFSSISTNDTFYSSVKNRCELTHPLQVQ